MLYERSKNADLVNRSLGSGFPGILSNQIDKLNPLLVIEVLYRHNVLSSRAQLFKHCATKEDKVHPTDEKVVKKLWEDLGHCST